MFSYNRFYEQFKLQLYQNVNRHGMYLLIFVLFLFINHYKYVQWGMDADRTLFSGVGFFITLAALFHSIDVFSKLRSTSSGIHYLMLPATSFEKYLTALLYSTLFTFLAYILMFCMVHLLTVTTYNLLSPYDVAYAFPNLNKLWEILKDMFFFQSLFFLGSVLFKKNPFGKTTLIIVGSIVLFGIISGLIIKNNYPGTSVEISQSFTFNGPVDALFINGLAKTAGMRLLIGVLTVCSWIVPFLCWIAAYFRLKTVQI